MQLQVGSALAIASIITERKLWHDGPGAMPDEVVRKLSKSLQIGWWNARFGLYGPKDLAEARCRSYAGPSIRFPEHT